MKCNDGGICIVDYDKIVVFKMYKHTLLWKFSYISWSQNDDNSMVSDGGKNDDDESVIAVNCFAVKL